ncbi:MAG: hypothetical protein WCV93_03520 [Candidatus Shapirobacteria bacterium]|jgi:hypothetical protein
MDTERTKALVACISEKVGRIIDENMIDLMTRIYNRLDELGIKVPHKKFRRR